jgi:hypothetical protein
MLAFRPVHIRDRVIRLHPLVCQLLNADFDGDLVAVFLPLTEAGQREAGERLTVAAHLERDPALLPLLLPPAEALWGLAELSRTPAGLAELTALVGSAIAAPDGFINRATLAAAMRQTLARDGVTATLAVLVALLRRGLAVSTASGASLSPFIGATVDRPPLPVDDDLAGWSRYVEEVAGRLLARSDYDEPDLGPQLLAVKSAAWGTLASLGTLVGSPCVVSDRQGHPLAVRRGYADGVTAAELRALAVGAAEHLARAAAHWQRLEDAWSHRPPTGFHVLARAMRAARPGLVFARAAATRERDPLTDVASRLFVGLPVAP